MALRDSCWHLVAPGSTQRLLVTLGGTQRILVTPGGTWQQLTPVQGDGRRQQQQDGTASTEHKALPIPKGCEQPKDSQDNPGHVPTQPWQPDLLCIDKGTAWLKDTTCYFPLMPWRQRRAALGTTDENVLELGTCHVPVQGSKRARQDGLVTHIPLLVGQVRRKWGQLESSPLTQSCLLQ